MTPDRTGARASSCGWTPTAAPYAAAGQTRRPPCATTLTACRCGPMTLSLYACPLTFKLAYQASKLRMIWKHHVLELNDTCCGQALQLRRARQKGLQVGGLGFGSAPTRSEQLAALLRTHERLAGPSFC